MEKKEKAGVSRWWTVAILAAGIAIGTMLTATPVYSHVGGTVANLLDKAHQAEGGYAVCGEAVRVRHTGWRPSREG